MQGLVYQNKRGEQVLSYGVFKELNLNAIMHSLIPCRMPISRRQRRLANGSLKEK